ncbi:MAG: beta-ketoacyl-[acyl-carrier-protein] synthase family protein [Acidobacteria bacterium]|jgi:3-oxoacyl-(acyl-carrier-protein) synthase|nr:beta-ketoacyl-[acyl-carrier-protein] synthase family protein [Acidobacteriota bacterium]
MNRKERRVVITGIGVVAPQAVNTAEFWTRLQNNTCSIEPIHKCDTRLLKVKYAGQINDVQIQAEQYFGSRYLKKCDDFSVYALLAVREALADAALDIQQIGPGRIGIYVGNNSGGWHAAEKGLKDLHDQGAAYISPFLASNWFPAAPQGHISIYYQMLGYSKTVSADMASSTVAIGKAYKLIKNGTCDFMVAGGTENLVNRWGLLFYQTNTILGLGEAKGPAQSYQPFGKDRSGLVLGEGAAFVILETLTSALERNASIYGEICGFGLTNDGYHYRSADPSGKQYARAVMMAMGKEKRPGYISLNGAAVQNEDYAEVNGLKRAFGTGLAEIPCSCPKAFYGHTYGAAGAMDLVTACLTMKNNIIIKTGFVEEIDPGIELPLVTKTNRECRVKSALIINKGLGGINSALYIKKNNRESRRVG